MISQNYHTHTSYCDGTASPEEMIRAAVAKGMTAIGFSGHGFTSFDPSYCMSREGTKQYQAELLDLKGRYADAIQVLIGIEQDYYGDPPQEPYEYVIGSAHYVYAGGQYLDVDESAAKQDDTVRRFFDGDYYKYTAAYYEMMEQMMKKTECTIIGHFDLVTKFNEGFCRFDEEKPEYYMPAYEAAASLSRQGGVFEINTGAMWKGYRRAPYPSAAILKVIRENGGRIVFSSDSHDPASLCCFFPEAEELARSCGFTSRWYLEDGVLKETAL